MPERGLAARRLARSLVRSLADVLWGFGLADGALLLVVFAFGAAYRVFDLPVYGAFLYWLIRLTRATHPAGAKWFAGLAAFVTAFLAATSLLAELLPRFSQPDLWVRAGHHVAAPFATLMLAVFMARHARLLEAQTSTSIRALWTGRAAWLLLKLSAWSGAIVALLVILPGLIGVHVVALAIGLPLLALRRPGVAPDKARSLLAAAAAGALAAGAVAAIPIPYWSSNIASGLASVRVGDLPTLAPSAAQSSDGAAYHPAFLGQSATCGSGPCHFFIFSDWDRSAHRRSAGNAYQAAVEEVAIAEGPEAPRLCAGCHDPIALFSRTVGGGHDLTTPESRREGISCLLCHTLAPREGASANGSLRFDPPRLFASVPFDPRSSISMLDRHRDELGAPSLHDPAKCVACHRLDPGAASGAASGAVTRRWLEAPVHAQPRMIEACRGTDRCLECHMRRHTRNDRPGRPPAPNHAFLSTSSDEGDP